MFTELIMKCETLSGFANIIVTQISPDDKNIFELIDGSQVSSRTAANIQNFKTGPDVKLFEIYGDHGLSPGRPPRFFQLPFAR